ncbi:Tryptophan synthase beta chain [Flexistipes sinusarabici DSM 4947]|uniref:Tryptophan synthase beta chain n=1 Tax=Flexistipes sinusarabici (strain ATCC 49648 / DSM 4947 / MAS 10) TaxID=717231 RepID=F8E515_FLESM|nr:tryptophan synthase subunit beta [Flexistipes sinusarabici]AEI15651.1 Tryptophan synthase beta chain [Flexistipes sinusarabici DSM 4947]
MNNGFYGEYGGQFVAETLMPALNELERNFFKAKNDANFNNKFLKYMNDYAGRPTPVYYAENLSEKYGFNLYLKREDLLHTGAHKINNTIGQALLALQMGKKRIIAETGAGQHGVATATACALFNLECEIYMGKTDAERQRVNVEKMEMLGAKVTVVDKGSKTLKDAVSACLKDWVANVDDTHYLLGSALGPHPFPSVVSHFQSVIGREAREYFESSDKLPDYVIACVGGGSNAIGIFRGFMDTEVELIGVEAGGLSDKPGEHAIRFGKGQKGIFQGSHSYVILQKNGQIAPVHSVSAGLDYPGVGPEHAFLKDSKRVKYEFCRDEDAIFAFYELTRNEGIIPALESSHALGYIFKNSNFFKEKNILLNLSGRGDKDLEIVREYRGGSLS